MNQPTSYSAYFFNGTMTGYMPFTYDKVRPIAIEMIVNMLKNDPDFNTKKELADFLYDQTRMIEDTICRFSDNKVITETTIEMVARFYEKTVEEFKALWCCNIVAMLEMKRIRNNDKFGYMVEHMLSPDDLKELQKKCSHSVGVQASRRRRGKSKKKNRRGQTYAQTVLS